MPEKLRTMAAQVRLRHQRQSLKRAREAQEIIDAEQEPIAVAEAARPDPPPIQRQKDDISTYRLNWTRGRFSDFFVKKSRRS